MAKGIKPGMVAKCSGQYAEVGPRGGKSRTEVTLVKGKTVPPTDKKGSTYILVDATKHKKR